MSTTHTLILAGTAGLSQKHPLPLTQKGVKKASSMLHPSLLLSLQPEMAAIWPNTATTQNPKEYRVFFAESNKNQEVK